MEASEADLEFDERHLHGAGHRPTAEMPLAAVAFAAFTAHDLPDGMEPNLEAQVTYDPPNFSWPFGTHICVVEVDEETGHGRRRASTSPSTTAATRLNPMIVEGQVHGGVIQGLAQALFEEAVYDEDGNLLTSTPGRLPGARGVRRPVDHDRSHRHPEPHQPARGQGHRRGGHHRQHAGGDERRGATPCPTWASPTSRCRRHR